MSALTPYQKIMRAAKRRTGLRLSPDEVRALSGDDAIATVAMNDDAGEADVQCRGGVVWPPQQGGEVSDG